jgi:hypothetical protein
MDPETILAIMGAISGAIGAMQEANFRNKTNANFEAVMSELKVIEAKLDAIANEIYLLPWKFKIIADENARKQILTKLQAQRQVLETLLAATPRLPDPSKDRRTKYSDFADRINETTFDLAQWGDISYPAIAHGMIAALISFAAGNVAMATRTKAIEIYKQTFTKFRDDFHQMSQTFTAKAADLDNWISNFPRQGHIGYSDEQELDSGPPDGSGSMLSYCQHYYFTMTITRVPVPNSIAFATRVNSQMFTARTKSCPNPNPGPQAQAPGYPAGDFTGADPQARLNQITASVREQARQRDLFHVGTDMANAHVTALNTIISHIGITHFRFTEIETVPPLE